jgi:tetratricopeptide (TPR) repeat protein
MNSFIKSALILCLKFLIMPSCSSLNQQQGFKIQSEISEINIYSSQGDFIGKTPLELNREEMRRLGVGENHYQFHARKEGFVDGQYSLVLLSPTTIKISLSHLGQEHFNQWILKKYSRETNKMIKEILEIQSLVFSSDRSQLENRISEFNQTYQNLAPAYTLQGSVYLRDGKYVEARQSLDRALSIDPEDLTAKRLVEEIERGSK